MVACIHARQASHATAAQQLQQHRFSLVIEMVGGQEQSHPMLATQFSQRPIALLAGGRLHAGLGAIDLHQTVIEGDLQGSAFVAAMRQPCIGMP